LSEDDEDEPLSEDELPVPEDVVPSVADEPVDGDALVVPALDDVDALAGAAPSAGSLPSCTRSASTPKTATIDASAAAANWRREGARRGMQSRLHPALQATLNPA
jgi:hypothetical protein